jgi:hypothetical protein
LRVSTADSAELDKSSGGGSNLASESTQQDAACFWNDRERAAPKQEGAAFRAKDASKWGFNDATSVYMNTVNPPSTIKEHVSERHLLFDRRYRLEASVGFHHIR